MNYFLTIAASDNSSGAGIQQDLKIGECLEVWGLNAITGIAVQSFNKVSEVISVQHEVLKKQIDSCFTSFDIKGVKTGAFCSDENIKETIEALKRHKPQFVVVDTVLSSSSGYSFINLKSGLEILINELFPISTIITPNKNEFELLTSLKFESIENAAKSALEYSEKWNTSIYLKGGHYKEKIIKEALISNGEIFFFEKPRINIKYQHGTGCAFSSALTCYLIKGYSLKEACEEATKFISIYYKILNLHFEK